MRKFKVVSDHPCRNKEGVQIAHNPPIKGILIRLKFEDGGEYDFHPLALELVSETVDITPTWSEILPTLLRIYENNPGSAAVRATREQLVKMASVADTALQIQKNYEEIEACMVECLESLLDVVQTYCRPEISSRKEIADMRQMVTNYHENKKAQTTADSH